MLDKLHQKRAVLVAQEQQHTASLNQQVNQVNMTRGAIAIIDEVIGEAQAEEAARQQVATNSRSGSEAIGGEISAPREAAATPALTVWERKLADDEQALPSNHILARAAE